MTAGAAVATDFAEFVASAQPRLQLALGSAFGFDVARDATADALSFAWEHWDRVSASENPVGYVFGIGRNLLLRSLRRRPVPLSPVRAVEVPWVEPGLPKALSLLSERQRQVVMLLHCFEWTLAEVAQVLDMSKGTVQVHDRRGLARLRQELGYSDD
jgi:DNA-directed RNA polymerase specialized sigma24 family protein